MLKRLIPVLIFISISSILKSQNIKGFGVEPNVYFGKLWKHTEAMEAPILGFSEGASLNLTYQTTGKKAWQRFHNYPTLGLTFGFKDYDDGPNYGDMYYASFYIERYYISRPNYKFYLRTVLGMAYLTKKYDVYTNPLQGAIATHWNGNFSLIYGVEWRLNDHFRLSTGAGIIHASNGGSTSKNLGLNILGGQLGLKYIPVPNQAKDFNRTGEMPAVDKKYEVEVEFNVGLVEQDVVFGGPFYPVYSYAAGIRRDINRRLSWMAGMEYEYNAKVRNFLNHIERFEPDERFWQSSRMGAYGGIELWYDRISLTLRMGPYFTNNYKQKLPIFNKFGVRYYAYDGDDFKLYIGGSLKTELIEAQYVSGTVGLRF